MYYIIWIISGILAGWLTGIVVKGRGFGLIGDLLIGLTGGLIGGWLAYHFGIYVTTWLGHILVAAMGGILLVTIVRILRRI